MNRFYPSKLLVLLTLLLGCNLALKAQTSVFSYTGTVQNYTVPSGITNLAIDMQGAIGGMSSTSQRGGYGGRVVCTLTVTPGAVLQVVVGGAGSNGIASTSVAGGYNNATARGGYCTSLPSYGGGGGGGGSEIMVSPYSINDRVVIAGAGGGGGCNCTNPGGNGGGIVAGNASNCSSEYCGTGGSTSPGLGGTYSTYGTSGNGALRFGGVASTAPTNSPGSAGGGGGGGYYGGGGGSWGGGGGGSSYTDPTLTSGITHTQGYNTTGNGTVSITPLCTPAVRGAITGVVPMCGIGVAIPLANSTASPGGVWGSLNPAVATISNTGAVTSVGIGTAMITYANIRPCNTNSGIDTAIVTVSTVPAAITGTTSVCAGNNVTLSTTTSGGAWSSASTFVATIGLTGIVTGVTAGTSIISYVMPSGCYSTNTVTVNNAPIGIGGTSSLCAGATTTLSNSTPGGTWFNVGVGIATVNSTSGLVTGVSAGTSNITYRLTSTGCFVTRAVTVNALPSPVSLISIGSTSYCSGGAGVRLVTTASSTTSQYQLFRNGSAFGGPVTGSGSGLDFGLLTPAGSYTLQATSNAGCVNNMTGSVNISINPLPTVYTLSASGTAYCESIAGVNVQTDNSDAGVLYTLSSETTVSPTVPSPGGALDFGLQPAGTYTLVATDPSTGCTSTMTGNPRIIMNRNPNVYDVYNEGTGFYCPYTAGLHVGLRNSTPGVNYELYNTGVATGIILPGSSSDLDFGAQTAGDYTVMATNNTTGCTALMNLNAVIAASALPTAYTVTSAGDGSYCAGGAGTEVMITPSDFTVKYKLYMDGRPTGDSLNGVGGMLSFGNKMAAGNYTIIGTDLVTGCYANMVGTAPVSINPLPSSYSFTPDSSYCAGGIGVHVGYTNSQNNVRYQLMYGGLPSGATIDGAAGMPLDFGLRTAQGGYTIVATNTVTGCTTTLADSAYVTINLLPDAYDVTGGGEYCTGGLGRHVGLSYSAVGVNYHLFNGVTPMGTVAGSSSGIDFGYQTMAGTYTVIGENALNGCQKDMNLNATIIVNTPPASYLLTSASSSYCAGGAGVDIMLSGSEAGIQYQLYNGSTPVGSAITGTGDTLHFGYQLAPGTYTVVGSNTISGCATNMGSSITLTINPLPTAYNVGGGGNYCVGGTGVHVLLSGSTTGVSYQLYNSITGMVGAPVAGTTGRPLDFGLQTGIGNYTVIATNNLTTCVNSMNGSATIGTNPLPDAHTVTGGGSYCAGGTGFAVGLDNSNSGMSYQLLLDGSSTGSPLNGSTGVALNYGLQTAPGTYTILATNVTTGCSKLMTGSATIVRNPLPDQYTVYGGGAYCAGGAGSHIYISGTATGVDYQLMVGTTPVGAPVAGTGFMVDFGAQTTAGDYTVVATNSATGCSIAMIGSANVRINPLPTVWNMLPGGSYCADMPGVDVAINLSSAGTNYQLYNGTTAVGTPRAGAGIELHFGPQRAGVYHVVAINPATGCRANMSGTAVVTENAIVTPAVAISSSTGSATVCSGSNATFTAIPTNGGSTPSYQWKVNGVNVGAGSSYNYTPAMGDIVTTILTSSEACARPTTATNNLSITVSPVQTPAVTLSASTPNTVCRGTAVTFTADVNYGGTAPTYTWIKNSTVVATGSTTFTYAPADGDVVIFMMGSNFTCRTTDTVFSNSELMTVEVPAVPTVAILATPGTSFAPGQSITLKAIVTNGGTTPTYQWYLNGRALAGANTQSFTSSSFNDGDSVSCQIVSSGACGGVPAFNSVVMTKNRLGVQPVNAANNNISVAPNPNKGTFTVKGTFAVTNDQDVTIEVANMLGQIVYATKAQTTNGDINTQVQLDRSLPNGMYILSVRSGAENTTFHIVIEQ